MSLKNEIQDVMEMALTSPGVIQVIRAAPGQGKSYNAVQALAELMHTGRVRRVLWAVRETVNENSLAKEALEQLRDAGLNANIVLGRDVVRRLTHSKLRRWSSPAKAVSNKNYRAQFQWLTEEEVKVVSHKHLALIYGKDSRLKGGRELKNLRHAQLLIVDEDPSDVFLLNDGVINETKSKRKKMYLNSQFFENRKDDISVAVSQLLVQAAAGDLDESAEHWGLSGKKSYSLTGTAFWDALATLLPSTPSWTEFAHTMGSTAVMGSTTGISPWVISQMRHAYAQFTKGGVPSVQFGLTWPEKRHEKASLNVRFRFDVSQYRPIPCAVVVLDAYAEMEHYATAFSPSVVRLHQVGSDPVLKVITAVGLGRHRQTVASGKGSEHTLALTEQIVEYARAHGNTLLLCYSDTQPFYQAALTQALQANPLPEEIQIEVQHWRAGRGSNRWEGWNIIALEEFALPTAYRRHSLSAVVPEDSSAAERLRKQLWELHSASENLQMFYRGRQTLAAARGWKREPEVIVLYQPNLFGLNSKVALEKDTSRFTKAEKRTTKPRFAKALHACVEELETLLGAVPLLTIAALGLENRKNTVRPETLEHVRAKLRELTLASISPLPLLRGWAERGQLPGYEETRATKRSSRVEWIEDIRRQKPALNEIRDVRPAYAPKNIRRVRGTVLADSAAAAQDAVNLLFSELKR